MENVVLLERHIVSTEIVLFHVLVHLFLAQIIKLINNCYVNVCTVLLQLFRNFRQIFVNVSTINRLLEILVHLNDL